MTVAAARDMEFKIELVREIEAPIATVWDILLDELGPGFITSEGNSLQMKIEPRPGGRWYRDLGDENGHLWGHVQAIKRPTLIELTGPLFISDAVCNNVQYRLEESDGRTTIRLVHSAFGILPEDLRDGMPEGWEMHLDRVVERAA